MNFELHYYHELVGVVNQNVWRMRVKEPPFPNSISTPENMEHYTYEWYYAKGIMQMIEAFDEPEGESQYNAHQISPL